jgi:hypothetical protein
MSKENQTPTITEDLGLIEVDSAILACSLIYITIKNAGWNEKIDGRVVGPIFDDKGRPKWGVKLIVLRFYPPSALDQITWFDKGK